jgi:beta-lactamase class A
MTRRALMAGALASFLCPTRAPSETPLRLPSLGPGAEYAWASLDLQTGKGASLNPDLRMPMCSSFKWLLGACVLARVDRGHEHLERRLVLGPQDILTNSPTVAAALEAAGGQRVELSVAALCAIRPPRRPCSATCSTYSTGLA